MKRVYLSSSMVLMLSLSALLSSFSYAATDGIYNLTQAGAAWDGTNANRLQPTSADYDYTYGDEESLSYSLPWTFTFYGEVYNQINVDTNGNIWFASTGIASSFSLPNAGRGPVIAAWNNDLSSYYDSGIFIQHKTNPERIVVEWRAETYTEEGNYFPNDFEVVLFQNGEIRFDYSSFASMNSKDFGSGISKDDSQHYLNLSAAYGNVFALAGHSYTFVPVANGSTVPEAPIIGTATGGNAQATVTFSPPLFDGGSAITGYTVISNPAGGVDANAGTTSTTHLVTGLANGTSYTFTVTATNAVGTGPASLASNLVTPSGPVQYTLTVTKLGHGTISSSPASITCGAVCSAAFTESTPVTLTATPIPEWSFIGWSGACSGVGSCDVIMDTSKTVNARFVAPSKIGVFSNGYWYLDSNRNGVWDGTAVDILNIFNLGFTNAVPVSGDWTGDGKTKIGVYLDGIWYLDLNGNGIWDEVPTDGEYFFGGGVVGAVPVTGDWNGDGKTKIGIYAGGYWYLDLNGNGSYEWAPTDLYFTNFGGGVADAVPVTGDWNGDGQTEIGIYAGGVWYLDLNGNGSYEWAPTDLYFTNFGGGLPDVVPMAGNW